MGRTPGRSWNLQEMCPSSHPFLSLASFPSLLGLGLPPPPHLAGEAGPFRNGVAGLWDAHGSSCSVTFHGSHCPALLCAPRRRFIPVTQLSTPLLT